MKRLTINHGAAKKVTEVKMTLSLPRHLHERVRRQVEREDTSSVNDFIVTALATYVEAVERRALDDAFCGMARDKQYQREALCIVQEFGG